MIFVSLWMGVSSSALVLTESLSDTISFQNQNAELPPSKPGTGVDTRLHTVTISNVLAGGNLYDINFLFGNSWGSSGLVERYIDMRSTLGTIELSFLDDAPNVVVAYEISQIVDDGLDWYDAGSKDIIMVRYLDILGSEVNQGQFQGEGVHYAAFRFVDGMDYYYGYVELTISDYSDHPTLSVSGYAFESVPNTAISIQAIAAVPEVNEYTLMLSLVSLLGVIRLRRRK